MMVRLSGVRKTILIFGYEVHVCWSQNSIRIRAFTKFDLTFAGRSLDSQSDPKLLHVNSEYSDQTSRLRGLTWIFLSAHMPF